MRMPLNGCRSAPVTSAIAFADDMDEGGFDARRRQILQSLGADVYTDKSPKGSVDDHVLVLCNLLNTHKDIVTTSSCSGRISCFVNACGRAKGGRWAFISHDVAEPQEVLAAVHKEMEEHGHESLNMTFKFEPFVLHCEVRWRDSASRACLMMRGVVSSVEFPFPVRSATSMPPPASSPPLPAVG